MQEAIKTHLIAFFSSLIIPLGTSMGTILAMNSDIVKNIFFKQKVMLY